MPCYKVFLLFSNVRPLPLSPALCEQVDAHIRVKIGRLEHWIRIIATFALAVQAWSLDSPHTQFRGHIENRLQVHWQL